MFTNRRLLALLLIFLAASPCFGQQAPTQSPAVHLPSAAPASVPNLDGLVRNFQFEELAQAVMSMPSSPERDYFAGMLANRQGHNSESIPLLEAVVPKLKASNPTRAALALHTLADDYVKLYRYNDALRAYEQLMNVGLISRLDKAERQSTEDDYKAVRLLRDAPSQAITFNGPVELATHRNKTLDTIDTSLTVNGVTEDWIVDTGANFTAISASFAKRIGLQLVKGKAQTQGITGAENDLRVGILPELKVGSATVRNVVMIVLNDDSFNVPAGEGRYQINAVLGYPVLEALQRVTFTADGHILAGPGSPSAEKGAPLYMNQLMPLLECTVEGRRVIFSFDTGANTSFFSDRYYREFPKQFVGLRRKPHGMGGAGGVRKLMAYYLPEAQLGVGSSTVTLHNIAVVPEIARRRKQRKQREAISGVLRSGNAHPSPTPNRYD